MYLSLVRCVGVGYIYVYFALPHFHECSSVNQSHSIPLPSSLFMKVPVEVTQSSSSGLPVFVYPAVIVSVVVILVLVAVVIAGIVVCVRWA